MSTSLRAVENTASISICDENGTSVASLRVPSCSPYRASRLRLARQMAAAEDLFGALIGAEKYVANALERHREAGRDACVAEATDKLAAIRSALAKARGE